MMINLVSLLNHIKVKMLFTILLAVLLKKVNIAVIWKKKFNKEFVLSKENKADLMLMVMLK